MAVLALILHVALMRRAVLLLPICIKFKPRGAAANQESHVRHHHHTYNVLIVSCAQRRPVNASADVLR